jgi:paraquat-inducible protein B
MSEAQATVSSGRRFPVIWLVPIVALVLGIWMVVYTVMTEGPEVTITFSTATGIEEGKTKVRVRNVVVGMVEDVGLNEDLESVSVVAELDRDVTGLLRDGTRFWVVRPRFGAGGVSGLGTVMSGAYIELEPGTGPPTKLRDFVGLEDLPVTPVGTPGLKIVLVSNRAGSVSVGDPLLFKGFSVGRVEIMEFDPETKHVRYHVFIGVPYDALVNKATRFWNASGITMQASAEGMQLHVGSLQSLLAGGVAFRVPEGKMPLERVENGAEFLLYDSYQSAREETYRHAAEYVVRFAQSVRGLAPGAAVEYRGIPIGTVERVLLGEAVERMGRTSGAPIPVLIRLEPGRLGLGDSPEAVARLKQEIVEDVTRGLRARLQSGSLITGRLYVAFDFYPEEGAAKIGSYAGYPTLPTHPGGLELIERQISQVLANLGELPLDRTVRELNATLAELRAMAGSDAFKEIPTTLNDSLTRLERTLQSFEELARTDPEPRGDQ